MKKGSCTKSLFCLVLMVCCIFSWFPSGSVMTVAQAAEDAPAYTLSIEIEPGAPAAKVTIAQTGVLENASADEVIIPQENGTLYICAYNAQGALISCEERPRVFIRNYSKKFIEWYTLPSDATEVKVFLWDYENIGTPLAAYAKKAVPASPHTSAATLRGTVTETNVSSLDYALSTGAEELQYFQLIISEIVSDEGDAYTAGQTVRFYADNLGAWQYLGQQVEVRLDDVGNVAAIDPLPLDPSAVSFTFDQYAGADTERGAYALRYWADPADDAPVSIPIADNAALVYNHAKGYYDFVDLFDEEDGLVSGWRSGRVTVTQDPATDRQIVFIEIAVTGVVEEVAENGNVIFKHVVGERQYNNVVRRLEFSSAEQKIYLTKDGQPFDWRQLQPWDVLSIVTNTDAGYYYTAEVLSQTISGVVDDYVESESSYDGYAYHIQGGTYDVAVDYYGSAILKAGAEGIFTIDTYGRLCAFRQWFAERYTYGYILDTVAEADEENGFRINIQVLDAQQKVWTAYLADKITVYNAYYNDTLYEMYNYELYEDDPDIILKLTDMELEEIEAVASALRGTLMTYRLDADQKIDRITLPAAEFGMNAGETLTGSQEDEGTFDLAAFTLGGYRVAQDTPVFFINGSGNTQAGQGTAADDETSSVGTALNLTHQERYTFITCFSDALTEAADVAVVYNAQPSPPIPEEEWPKPSEPADTGETLACIADITAAADGTYRVRYYGDGVLKTANTASGFAADYFGTDTAAGSVFWFTMDGSQITAAEPCLIFDGTVRKFINSAAETGQPKVLYFNELQDGREELLFGAVVEKLSPTRISVQPIDPETGLIDINSNTYNVSLRDYANYVLYDPKTLVNHGLSEGSPDNIDRPDPDLLYEGYTVYLDRGDFVLGQTPVYGMMDYVFVRYVDGMITDVITYFSYLYSYDIREN